MSTQLSLGGEFDWTKEDDIFLQKLAPPLRDRVLRLAMETGERPKNAWLQLQQHDLSEDVKARSAHHAP